MTVAQVEEPRFAWLKLTDTDNTFPASSTQLFTSLSTDSSAMNLTIPSALARQQGRQLRPVCIHDLLSEPRTLLPQRSP